ncbi:MAG: hypothetical protein GY910_24785 [bacterium]|nr:hypothetical protein [bacterium]
MENWPESPEEWTGFRERVLSNPIYRGTLISREANLTTITIRPQVYSSDPRAETATGGFEEAGESSSTDATFITEPELNEVVRAVFERPGFPVHVVGDPVIRSTWAVSRKPTQDSTPASRSS